LARIRYEWSAIAASPKFKELTRRKTRFLAALLLFSIAYYLLLPIGAAYFPDLFAMRVAGPINLGLLFALSEFLVAWAVAIVYTRRANADFDPAAHELCDAATAAYRSTRSAKR